MISKWHKKQHSPRVWSPYRYLYYYYKTFYLPDEMYLLHADHIMVTVANIIHLEMPYLLSLPITPSNSLPIRVCYLCYLCYVFRAFEPHACCIDIVFNRSAISLYFFSHLSLCMITGCLLSSVNHNNSGNW